MERKNGLPPVHPGEIIKEDILAERKPMSAVMCLKVSRLFGGSPEVWMRLQATYDLKKVAQNKKVMQRVARIVPVKPLEEIRT